MTEELNFCGRILVLDPYVRLKGSLHVRSNQMIQTLFLLDPFVKVDKTGYDILVDVLTEVFLVYGKGLKSHTMMEPRSQKMHAKF